LLGLSIDKGKRFGGRTRYKGNGEAGEKASRHETKEKKLNTHRKTVGRRLQDREKTGAHWEANYWEAITMTPFELFRDIPCGLETTWKVQRS